MCRAVQGSEFDLAPRYGEVLNLMALAFTFAASLPLMLPIAAAVLLLAYWAQLAELLRASRRPPAQARPPPPAVGPPPCTTTGCALVSTAWILETCSR